MRVVVIRFSSFGDCILLMPLLAHLKASGADEVVVVTKETYAPLFACAQGADRVVAFDPGDGPGGLWRIGGELRGPDTVVIDAHNNPRSRLLSWRLGGARARFDKHYRERLGLIVLKRPAQMPTILEQYARLARDAGLGDAPAVPGGFTVPAGARERTGVPPGHTAVAVAPGSRWETKRWSEDRFIELCTALVDGHGCHIVLVGDEHDASIAATLSAALGEACTDATARAGGRVAETAAWIERCRVFVGNDSGLMHLAEAVGVPAVGLFGPTVRAFGYAPALESSHTVERNLACRPCSRNGSRPCPRRRQICLDIEAAVVEAAVLEAMRGNGTRHHVVA